jgi:GAF domain-containing protein
MQTTDAARAGDGAGDPPLYSPEDISILGELAHRPSRAADHEAENAILSVLADALAERPANLLQTLTDILVEKGIGETAGISLLEGSNQGDRFRWAALSGVWAGHKGSTLPSDASPCGVVVRHDCVLLLRDPEQFFPGGAIEPSIDEALLIPFHAGGKPIGTLWVSTHGAGRRFEAEDVRLLKSLSRFAAASAQIAESVREARADGQDGRDALTADLHGLRRLHELYAKLASQTDLDIALHDILAAAVALTGTDRGVVQRVSKDGLRLEFAAHQGYGEGTRFTEHFRLGRSEAACDAVRQHRARLVIEDIATFPALAGTVDREIALAEDVRATFSMPMVGRTGELIGVLNTQFRTPHRPSDREMRLMDMLAWTAAGFIERHESAEAALQTSQERYRILFDAIDEGFYFARAEFDAEGRCTDILYEDENPAAIRMIGRSAKGFRLSALGDYEDYWRGIFGDVARTGEARRLEHYATPDGIWYDFYVFKPPQAGPDEFAVVFRNVTERRQAEEVLRESEERQAFLLKLSDTLRPLSDADDVVAAAAEALGRHLGAGQVTFAECEPGDEYVTIAREWNDGSIPSNAKRHRLDAFGPDFIAELKRGGSTAIADVARDPRTASPEALATFAQASIVALLNVPLVKNGRLAAILGVHSNAARAWAPRDVAIAQDVAERIWSEVERARAETALRTSEEQLRLIVGSAGLRHLHHRSRGADQRLVCRGGSGVRLVRGGSGGRRGGHDFHTRGPRGGRARKGACDGAGGGTLRQRALAPAQGRITGLHRRNRGGAAYGQRRAQRLPQDRAGRDRAHAGAGA